MIIDLMLAPPSAGVVTSVLPPDTAAALLDRRETLCFRRALCFS